MVRGLRPSSPASSPIRIALASIACIRPGVTEPRSVLPRAPARSRGRIEADPGQDLAEPGVADAGLVIGDAHLAGAVVWQPPQWIWRTVIVTVVIMASYVPAPMPPAAALSP